MLLDLCDLFQGVLRNIATLGGEAWSPKIGALRRLCCSPKSPLHVQNRSIAGRVFPVLTGLTVLLEYWFAR